MGNKASHHQQQQQAGGSHSHRQHHTLPTSHSATFSSQSSSAQQPAADSKPARPASAVGVCGTLPANYGSSFRRYYPAEYRQQRASSTFFRSSSLQLYFLHPQSEHGSPIAKKYRRNCSTTGASLSAGSNGLPESSRNSAHSLQPPFIDLAHIEHIDDDSPRRRRLQMHHMMELSDILEEVSPRTEQEDLGCIQTHMTANGNDSEMATTSDDACMVAPEDPMVVSCPPNVDNSLNVQLRRQPFKRPPIPASFTSTSITSSSRPVSSCVSTPPPRPASATSNAAWNNQVKPSTSGQSAAWLNATPVKQPVSAGSSKAATLRSSMRSLQSSTSFAGSLFEKLNSRRKRKSLALSGTAPSEASTLGVESLASLNSLTDGRTPWPIPWLEAIFLPEYPNKGPVSEKHFQVIGTIASGAFGKVYRVCMKSSPENIFAMKVQSKSEVISREAIQQIKDEVSIHESVTQCTFVASLYASWQSRSSLYIVLQYVMGYGDLYQLWRDMGPLTEPVVRIYAVEVALALDFLHSHGVIYRDLKMENIVLDENGHIQVVDFGLAKWLGSGDTTRTICGTLHYMAPEIAHSVPYTHAVDWWSAGVLVHVLLAGRYPFPAAKDHYSLNFTQYTPPDHATPPITSLINKLLSHDPDERLQSVHELKQQAFFDGFNFDMIYERRINPFDYMPRMHRCLSCNTLTSPRDKPGDQGDDSYLANNFDEQYDPFSEFEYFSEVLPSTAEPTTSGQPCTAKH